MTPEGRERVDRNDAVRQTASVMLPKSSRCRTSNTTTDNITCLETHWRILRIRRSVRYAVIDDLTHIVPICSVRILSLGQHKSVPTVLRDLCNSRLFSYLNEEANSLFTVLEICSVSKATSKNISSKMVASTHTNYNSYQINFSSH